MVSLPLAWSRRFDIDKKREVEIQESEDGSLLIIPGDIKKTEKEFLINIDKTMNSDKIYYKILKAYTLGYSKIIVSGELTDEQLDFLDMVHKRIVGLEVSEQKPNQIIFTDLLRIEDVNIDKIINQMFSFIGMMGKDILEWIKKDEEPGDRILDKNSLIVRNHNLAFKACNLALKDSLYLGKLNKTTNEILVISRILRHLDNIGINLIVFSYLLNKQQTPGMKKFNYKVYENKKRKLMYKLLKVWLKLFYETKKAVIKRDREKITDLYVRRFENTYNNFKKYDEFTIALKNIFEQMIRNTHLILRDEIMI